MRFIENAGGEGIFIQCNVSIEDDVRKLIDKIIEIYGTLDIAVNNAGVSPKRLSLLDYTEDIIDQIIDINLKSVFFCLKYEIKEMIKLNKGTIVNTASVLGLKAGDLKHSLYTASKHAVIGLTKSAALEFASHGIRINAVCPGGVDTEIHQLNTGTDGAKKIMAEMHPVKRLATPAEIASVIAFLCSDEASFITGVALPVDGGIMAG
jgi:NAD(P)-dependent dehydrogenase (short-subunit alcohol dehydrogenase family)